MTRGAETKTQTAKRFVGRVTLVLVFFSMVAAALAARAVQLQVLNKEFLNQQADTRHLRRERISAHRGTITDRNGEPLAISTPVDSVWANPKELAPAVDDVPQLARALGLDPQLLIRRITRSMDKEFLYLKRHLSPEQAQQVLALKLPGVNVQREYRRYYPAGEVTGHLVGFTDIDDEGQEGLELAFNHWLAGESGAKRVLKDRLGRSVENVESIRPARHGKNLHTSIDLRIQYLAYRTLKAAIQSYNAESGSIVVLDVNTGEVLAIVNQPTYNPNDRSQFSAERYRNRAVTDIFEPGSSIKPLVVAAALESGEFRPSSVIDTAPGYVTVGAKTIEDRRNLGRVSLTTILARSSNVGVTKLAMSLQPDQLWQTMTELRLGTLTSSAFPGESAGLLTHFSNWKPISQATLAYGYGVSVTALQLAQAYSALGNGGRLYPVSMVALESRPKAGRSSHRTRPPPCAACWKRLCVPAVPARRPSTATGCPARPALPGNRQAATPRTKYISICGPRAGQRSALAAVVVIDEPCGRSITAATSRRRLRRRRRPSHCACWPYRRMRSPARDPSSIVQAMSR